MTKTIATTVALLIALAGFLGRDQARAVYDGARESAINCLPTGWVHNALENTVKRLRGETAALASSLEAKQQGIEQAKQLGGQRKAVQTEERRIAAQTKAYYEAALAEPGGAIVIAGNTITAAALEADLAPRLDRIAAAEAEDQQEHDRITELETAIQSGKTKLAALQKRLQKAEQRIQIAALERASADLDVKLAEQETRIAAEYGKLERSIAGLEQHGRFVPDSAAITAPAARPPLWANHGQDLLARAEALGIGR